MNLDLLKMLLIISITSSVISTSFIQKIKCCSLIKCSNCLIYISFVISLLFGIFFTFSFTEYKLIDSIWVGLFSFIGSDSLYQSLEKKVFKSYSDINNVIEIERTE